MELFMFYRKIARRAGWLYVIFNFLKLKKSLETIKIASEKFSVKKQFDVWIKHPFLSMPISFIYVLTTDYENRRGQNYQLRLIRLFGGK